jgi:hypothetical protein
LLSETFDIYEGDGPINGPLNREPERRAGLRLNSGSHNSEEDCDSDGDHQQIIEHIARNRYLFFQ